MTRFLPLLISMAFLAGCSAGSNSVENEQSQPAGGQTRQSLPECDETDFGQLADRSVEVVPQVEGTGIVSYNEIQNIELIKYQFSIADDLVRSIAEICPGVLLITFNQGRSYLFEEKSANLFYFSDVQVPQSFIENTSAFVSFFNTPQRRIDLGLRDVIVNNGSLFFSSTEFDTQESCVFNSVYKYEINFNENSFSTPEQVYRSTPCVKPIEGAVVEGILNPSESGGRMQVNSDGEILLTTGHLALAHSYSAGGSVEKYAPYVEKYIDNPEAQYGAVINIGTGDEFNAGTIFAKGFRNPQGLAITESGEIFLSDHGPRGGDELNLIVEGKNYGWPHETYGIPYDAAKEGSPWELSDFWQDKYEAVSEDYEQPLFAWRPAIAPSQIIYYDVKGGEFRDFEGELVLATLKDLSVRIIKVQEERVLLDAPIYIGERVRDIHAMSGSGYLYALTDTTRLVKFQTYDFELPEE